MGWMGSASGERNVKDVICAGIRVSPGRDMMSGLRGGIMSQLH